MNPEEKGKEEEEKEKKRSDGLTAWLWKNGLIEILLVALAWFAKLVITVLTLLLGRRRTKLWERLWNGIRKPQKIWSLGSGFRRFVWPPTFWILVPLSIAFLAVAGAFVVFGLLEPEPKAVTDAVAEREVLRDVLMIVLATAAVVIAIIGGGAYLLLRNQLREEIIAAVRQETERHSMWLSGNSGYSAWLLHATFADLANATGKRSRLRPRLAKAAADWLKQAIDETEKALRHGRSLPPEDLLIVAAENNLAYYLARRKEEYDCETARRLAEHVERCIRRFPENRNVWEDTVAFVRDQCQ